MFNLDKKILGWRKQMLAAGIKTPVPLEELEVHLRDELEQQMKMGLNAQTAFAMAVEKVGHGKTLQAEFNKVANRPKIIRASLLIIGWLATGLLLLYFVACLEINWNFFSFAPRWNQAASVQIFAIAAVLSGIWFLVKASRDQASRIVSLLVCLCLMGFAASLFPHTERGILGGSREIPLWYRGGRTLLLCLPAIFWAQCEWRRIVHKRDSARADKLVHSN